MQTVILLFLVLGVPMAAVVALGTAARSLAARAVAYAIDRGSAAAAASRRQPTPEDAPATREPYPWEK